MAYYLDPKIDFLFKKIFGENKELLISFLNSLLPLKEGQEIVTLEYLSPEQVPANAFGKNSIVDVKCTDNAGRVFIVEMQSEWSNIFRKRLLVNGSKAVIMQMDRQFMEEKSINFNVFKPVYVLAIVNGIFSKGNAWYHHLQIIDPVNPDVVIDGLDFVLLELPKFTPETWSHTHKKIAVLWLRFLKEIVGYYEKLPEEFVSNKLIHSAVKICEEASFTPKEKVAYDYDLDQIMWINSIKALEDDAIESKKALAKTQKMLAEKDQSLAEKDAEIELLKNLLKKNKNNS